VHRSNALGGFASRCALALVLAAPATARATPPDDPVAQARDLYDSGRAKYETLDYAGAITDWTQAYAVLPATEDNRSVRNELAYNIASAQEKSFDLDGDVTHLRQARGLLERYLGEFKSLYKPTPENKAESQRVAQRIAELDAKIATASRASTGAAPARDQKPAPTPAQQERAAARAKEAKARQLLATDPELSKRYRSGRGLVIGGGTLLGVGALLVAAGAYTFTSDAPIAAGALVATGVVVAIPGAVLLPIGLKRMKGARTEARQRVVFLPPLPTRAGVMAGAIVRF
jgi:NAD(P)H-hydrate repair Nnr-like enzyme with NAD(P)H-hydrate dehydratase domain